MLDDVNRAERQSGLSQIHETFGSPPWLMIEGQYQACIMSQKSLTYLLRSTGCTVVLVYDGS